MRSQKSNLLKAEFPHRTRNLAFITIGIVIIAIAVLSFGQMTYELIAVLANQSSSDIVIISILGAAIVAGTIVIFKWNMELAALVSRRTSELVTRTGELELTNERLMAKSKELEATLKRLEETNRSLSEANEQLEIHDKLQREFVNIAAHELRTPVQPLLGAAEILDSQMADKDKVEVSRSELDLIIRNALRLERLSSDILAISRIESGALKLNKENFSLSFIMANAIKDAKAQSLFNHDKLKIIYYPDDTFVFADREKIIEVITNLLTNAIKFTEEGIIKVETRVDAECQMLQVTVSDTGIGIDPEVMPRIFDKFVTKSDKGTGIGLYICKKIVEAHGGSISANNKPEGGAEIRVLLPLTLTRDILTGE